MLNSRVWKRDNKLNPKEIEGKKIKIENMIRNKTKSTVQIDKT